MFQKGRGTLKDAMNEALRDWIRHVDTTYYLLGTGAGPHPYPTMVREFQKIIGLEARNQILLKENRLPDALVACVGGGSNALGLMHPFLEDLNVKMFGVEAGGKGTHTGEHAASICKGQVGVLHGNLTYLLQDLDGQILEGHSISAGLDYPGVGPEHGLLFETGRVTYTAITDQEAVNAFQLLSQQEGIIPALESSPCDCICDSTCSRNVPRTDHYCQFKWQRRQRLKHGQKISYKSYSMNRLDQKLEQLKLENRSGLVCYFTAGDPNFTESCRLLSQLGQAGADIIEVGIPFSDPVADGEIIQAAHLRALDAGQTVKQTIELVKVIRLHDDQTPIIFMTYLNPMMQYGFETLIAETENLIDGILILDAPYGYREKFEVQLNEKNMHLIAMTAPTTSS